MVRDLALSIVCAVIAMVLVAGIAVAGFFGILTYKRGKES